MLLPIIFSIIVVFSIYFVLFHFIKFDLKEFDVENIDEYHRKISKLSYSFKEKYKIIVKDPFPSSVCYQKKVNNSWINHNLNGPAVINYNAITGKVISEQYYINGELCENELQYFVAIGSYKEEN